MNDTSYRILYLLHIASIVVAFAPAVVGVLPGGNEGTRATLQRAGRIVYTPALILAGLFGVALIFLSDDVWAMDQTWISLAFLVWIAMNGVFHAMVLPTYVKGRKGGTTAGIDTGNALMTVLFLVMLYLMIWKPGV